MRRGPLAVLATLTAVLVAAGTLVTGGRAALAGPPAPTAFRFDGGGWGHGIGMSQYGAYGMGLRGVRAVDIIRFYYRGAVPAPATAFRQRDRSRRGERPAHPSRPRAGPA